MSDTQGPLRENMAEALTGALRRWHNRPGLPNHYEAFTPGRTDEVVNAVTAVALEAVDAAYTRGAEATREAVIQIVHGVLFKTRSWQHEVNGRPTEKTIVTDADWTDICSLPVKIAALPLVPGQAARGGTVPAPEKGEST